MKRGMMNNGKVKQFTGSGVARGVQMGAPAHF